ncbi:MAG: aspartate--ammonia ligase, partial [Eubacterium sp.]|nr:aspartate--ammonia ligase [Eubacterium sp.]
MSKEERNVEFLKEIVKKIVKAIVEANDVVKEKYPMLGFEMSDEVY